MGSSQHLAASEEFDWAQWLSNDEMDSVPSADDASYLSEGRARGDAVDEASLFSDIETTSSSPWNHLTVPAQAANVVAMGVEQYQRLHAVRPWQVGTGLLATRPDVAYNNVFNNAASSMTTPQYGLPRMPLSPLIDQRQPSGMSRSGEQPM